MPPHNPQAALPLRLPLLEAQSPSPASPKSPQPSLTVARISAADLVEQLKQTAVELDPAVTRIVHALTKLRADLQALRRRPHLSNELKHIQARVTGMRSAGLPVRLISPPINFFNCWIGSPITWHHTGARRQTRRPPPSPPRPLLTHGRVHILGGNSALAGCRCIATRCPRVRTQ